MPDIIRDLSATTLRLDGMADEIEEYGVVMSHVHYGRGWPVSDEETIANVLVSFRHAERAWGTVYLVFDGEDTGFGGEGCDMERIFDEPAVDLERRGSIQDDALGEVLVVLEKQEHALVKELLPEREAVLLLRAAKQDRTLLDERGLIDEAGRRLLACGLSNELCSHLAPVHIFGHACRGAAACMQRSTHGGCGYEEALRAAGEEGEHREGFGRVGSHCIF